MALLFYEDNVYQLLHSFRCMSVEEVSNREIKLRMFFLWVVTDSLIFPMESLPFDDF
jgi:hypothetical protein